MIGSMLMRVTTTKSVEELRESFPATCKKHGFGVLRVHDLTATLQEKGQDFTRPVVVFDVCNPVHANRVLTTNPAVSAALPCRVSAFALDGGGTELVTILPTMMMEMFQSAELAPVAAEVQKTLEAILNDVSG